MKILKKNMSLLLTVLLVAFSVMGTVSAAGADGERKSPEEILASMTAEEKITQMLMPEIRYYTDSDGNLHGISELTEDAAALLERYGFAGIAVFLENLSDTQKAVKLLDDMQRANAGHQTQLLFAADQEGGLVTRLGHGTQMPGNMALGAANDPELTAAAAEILGREIMSLGILCDAAPVLDVNSNPANPVIGTRSFSDDPEIVAMHGIAYMEALQSVGAVPTLKHFPGHGDTDTDSHTGLPLVDRSYEELQARELVPFKAAIDAGAEAVMTAHIEYPQIETETYISKLTGEEIFLPATLSKTILTDILRGDLAFDGVVLTDAMNMAAIKSHFDRYDAAQLAIEAGVDIILMPVDTSTAEGMADLGVYIETLTHMVENGDISLEKVDEAVLRILKLKADRGLTEPYSGTDPAASAIVGSAEHHEIEWEITKKAITLVKNDNNLLPLTGANEKVTVLTAYDNEVLSMEYAVNRLRDENKLASGMEVSVYSIRNSTAEEAAALTEGSDHVVIVSELYSAAGLTGDSAKKVDAVIESVHASSGDVTIMSCSLPYDAARYQDADAIVVAYSARGMSEDPRTVEVEGAPAQYGPNMPAALYLMLSPDETPTGHLPVDIPKLDSDFSYSEEVLYARGFGLSYDASDRFNDVDGGAWYSDGVSGAFQQGLMDGLGDGAFGPEDFLTRAQLVTVLWRMEGEPTVNYALSFEDVTEDGWYADALRWAASENIVVGYSDKVFAPDDSVSREQASLILFRYAKGEQQENSAVFDGFADSAEISVWARDAMAWAVREGIQQGYDGSLSPKEPMTRAEAARLLTNYTAWAENDSAAQ